LVVYQSNIIDINSTAAYLMYLLGLTCWDIFVTTEGVSIAS